MLLKRVFTLAGRPTTVRVLARRLCAPRASVLLSRLAVGCFGLERHGVAQLAGISGLEFVLGDLFQRLVVGARHCDNGNRKAAGRGRRTCVVEGFSM